VWTCGLIKKGPETERNNLILQVFATLDFLDVQLTDIVDKVLPACIKPKSTFDHLCDCFVLAPALHGDTVNRAHRPCAVGPTLSMHKCRRAVRIGSNLQKADHLFVLRVPRLHIDMLIR